MDAKKQMRLWVERWKIAGPMLEEQRHNELRAMTEEQSAAALNSLCEFAIESSFPYDRSTSGFVEQQRRFLKMRGR